jgi:hypothetical protein
VLEDIPEKWNSNIIFVLEKWNSNIIFVIEKWNSNIIFVLEKWNSNIIFVLEKWNSNIIFVLEKWSSRELGWIWHVARMEEVKSANKFQTCCKDTSKKLRYTHEDNIIIVFKETGVKSRIWIDLAQDRDHWRALVKAELNLRIT